MNDLSGLDTTEVSHEFVIDELQKQGLAEVVHTNDHDVGACLDTDYFLRLVNCQTQVAQKCQQFYIEQAIKRRRLAYKNNDWAEYADIVKEMGEL